MINKQWIAAGFIIIQTCIFGQRSSFKIEIHPEKVISDNFIGHGVEWSAYPHADATTAEWGLLMTDAKWKKVFHRLDYMKPKIVRVMDQANWRYLKGFDTKGDPIVSYEGQEMAALYKLLDYCEKNKITVILGEWGQPYKVHDTKLQMQNSFTDNTDTRWHRLIADFVQHLIVKKNYTVIKYYNIINEPNGYWSTIDGNWKEWKAAVNGLQSEFDKKGISSKIKIIGPDATPYNNKRSEFKGIEWAEQSAVQLGKVLGAYDIHDYPTKEFVRSGDFEKHYSKLVEFTDKTAKKPFIIGEIGFEKYTPENIKRYEVDPYASPDSQLSIYDYDYGVDMADVLAQSMNAGFDAVIAWGLDDAMHTNGDMGDRHELKKWGMWNILGKELTGDEKEEDIRPWFYTWSLMTRFYPSGMTVVKSSSDKDITSFRTVSGISKDGNVTITFVNNGTDDLSFELDQRSVKNKKFKKYLYTEKNRKMDAEGFPLPLETGISSKKNNIKVSIPAKSVVLLTTYNF